MARKPLQPGPVTPLRALRLGRGLTIGEIARAGKISSNTVMKFEKGDSVSKLSGVKCLRAFGIEFLDTKTWPPFLHLIDEGEMIRISS